MAIINVSNATGTRIVKERLSDTDKVNLVFNPLSAGSFYAGLTNGDASEVQEKFRTKELKASDIERAIRSYNVQAEEAFRLLAIPSVQAEVVKVKKAEAEALAKAKESVKKA